MPSREAYSAAAETLLRGWCAATGAVLMELERMDITALLETGWKVRLLQLRHLCICGSRVKTLH